MILERSVTPSPSPSPIYSQYIKRQLQKLFLSFGASATSLYVASTQTLYIGIYILVFDIVIVDPLSLENIAYHESHVV